MIVYSLSSSKSIWISLLWTVYFRFQAAYFRLWQNFHPSAHLSCQECAPASCWVWFDQISHRKWCCVWFGFRAQSEDSCTGNRCIWPCCASSSTHCSLKWTSRVLNAHFRVSLRKVVNLWGGPYPGRRCEKIEMQPNISLVSSKSRFRRIGSLLWRNSFVLMRSVSGLHLYTPFTLATFRKSWQALLFIFFWRPNPNPPGHGEGTASGTLSNFTPSISIICMFI